MCIAAHPSIMMDPIPHKWMRVMPHTRTELPLPVYYRKLNTDPKIHFLSYQIVIAGFKQNLTPPEGHRNGLADPILHAATGDAKGSRPPPNASHALQAGTLPLFSEGV